MRQSTPVYRDLVLVGGGHSHALALRMLAMKPVAGLRITLISPQSRTPYSGMLPGLIAGHYTFSQTHIDLVRLCQWAGARFVRSRVTGLDSTARSLHLDGRPAIAYDVVSLDIGSQPELDSVPGAREFSVPVKPVSRFWDRWQAVSQAIGASSSGAAISLVGGGAGSVELALAMAHQLASTGVSIDLWCGGSQILSGYNHRARQRVMAALQRHGVAVHCNARVVRVDSKALHLQGGESAAYDQLFWCTGASAAAWVAASGLLVDERGFLAVGDTLQSLQEPRVFAAGDIATQVNHPRPKAGVYAVRQAPTLAANLRAFVLDKPLRTYRPQKKFLSLISLGDKKAVADKGVFSAGGAWVWRWKNRIDTAFMRKFEQLPTMAPRRHWGVLSEVRSADQQPPCGGCGAKVGADSLQQALRGLAADYPRLITIAPEDAAVVPMDHADTLLQSIDVLRQLVSDPWIMGRIAANHALSDLYACAARPVSALASISLEFSGDTIQERDLRQILAGALHEFSQVGCVLAGGHTLQGPELNVGFVVNGVQPRGNGGLRKTGGQPGDVLILTKPLGTGAVFAAHMQLAAAGEAVEAAIDSMLQSNAAAASLLTQGVASACTDVTGFGLAGHLQEMLGNTLAARIHLSQLPVLPGALHHLAAGVHSTMHRANMRSTATHLNAAAGFDQARFDLLFDPQTSGGLLIACHGDAAPALLSGLQERGYTGSAVIGELLALPDASPNAIEICA